MSSTTPKTDKVDDNFKKHCSYRNDFPNLEESLGHVPDYNEEQESEVPDDWFEPLKG
tara:strand:- start:2479 stop:2649 length:171 start_codon:yes stop_codon:yes gene_type:complete